MRKLSIIVSATRLFGDLGYEKSTTSMIAKEAGISEALIFKHFRSKEGLLRQILKEGYKQIILNHKGMLTEADPLELIHKVLDLPCNLINDNPEFWKMQASLINMEICKNAHQRFMKPVHQRLVDAFSKLNYAEPEMEMQFLILIIESLWVKHAKDPTFQSKEMIDFIKLKYNH